MPRTSPSADATPKPRKASRAAQPNHEEIALRAYHIYLSRNGAPGNPFDDWKQAEQELLAARPKPRTRKSKVVPFAA